MIQRTHPVWKCQAGAMCKRIVFGHHIKSLNRIIHSKTVQSKISPLAWKIVRIVLAAIATVHLNPVQRIALKYVHLLQLINSPTPLTVSPFKPVSIALYLTAKKQEEFHRNNDVNLPQT